MRRCSVNILVRTGLILVSGGLFLGVLFSPDAHAATGGAGSLKGSISNLPASDVSEPSGSMVCISLDIEPTEQGLTQLGTNMAAEGFTPEQAGQTIGQQVTDVCPRHLGLIKRYVEAHP